MCSSAGLKEHYYIGEDESTTPTFLIARQILSVEQEEDRHLCCVQKNCQMSK